MSRPSNRRGPGRVSVQVARPGGAGADEVPTRGRHRSPDAEGAGPVLAASSLVGAPRHRRARPEPAADAATGRVGLPARSLERVDAAREAASRPATAPTAAPAVPARAVPADVSTTSSVPTPDEDAVTDLVVRPGRGALSDGPGSGPQPAVLGCAVSVVALVATVVTAAVPAPGGSHASLYGVLAVALLGTATAALGLGRQRPRRALAATGVVVGAAAVVAGLIPLLAL